MSDPAPAAEVTRPTRHVAAATLLSRVLGLVRDKATVFVFSGATADALLLAWTIPNLFRRLFGEGALAVALVPVLADREERHGAAARDRAASSVVLILAAFLAALTALLLLGLWLLPSAWFLAPFESEEVAVETLALVRWMLPYLVLICVAAQLQGIANLVGRFFLPAVLPAVTNLLWIAAALAAVVAARDAPRAEWIAGAVLLAGVVQVVLQLRELRGAGVRLGPGPIDWGSLRVVALRAAPMMLGLAASQINLLADRYIAEVCIEGVGAIRQLYLGNRLMQLPLGLIGAAVSTAVYPVFARAAGRGDEKLLASTLALSLRLSLSLALPALAGLLLLGGPIMELLFEGGRFTAADSAVSGACLQAYAATLLLQTLVLLLARVDYARGRQRQVVFFSVVSVAANVAFDLLLVGPLGAPGLALGTTLATGLNAVLLATRVDLHPGGELRRRLLGPALRVAAAAAGMALVVGAIRLGCEQLGLPRWSTVPVKLPVRAGVVVILGTAGGLLGYLVLLRALAPEVAAELREVLRGRRRKEA